MRNLLIDTIIGLFIVIIALVLLSTSLQGKFGDLTADINNFVQRITK